MGKYFSVGELTYSDTAERKGINNKPNKEETQNLINLIKVLDVIREELGEPIIVNSGFRCPELNNAVGGSKTSWHLKGMAVDIRCSDNLKLWDLIVDLQKNNKIHFTELINEYADSKGNPKWVHIAVNPALLRNRIKFIK